jgi:nucleotide-binding universal stress UspA family protein
MKLLVTPYGSEYAERVLPYVKSSSRFESVVLLLSVPYVPQSERFGAAVDEIEKLRLEAVSEASEYLEEIACVLESMGVHTEVIVSGSRPAQTIITVAQDQGVDVIMMATHGRGGVDRLYMGSVADRVIHHTSVPVFLVPIQERRQGNAAPGA